MGNQPIPLSYLFLLLPERLFSLKLLNVLPLLLFLRHLNLSRSRILFINLPDDFVDDNFFFEILNVRLFFGFFLRDDLCFKLTLVSFCFDDFFLFDLFGRFCVGFELALGFGDEFDLFVELFFVDFAFFGDFD